MSKKVISFSLYGTYPEYTLGAIDNVRHARWFYPDWVCRFYVADDTPQNIVARLKYYGAEIINMGQDIGHTARLWRFLVAVDPEIDISIVRDTDSRFSKYELKMVDEWLASGKKFHVMYPASSSHPIQAGMWGVRGTVPKLREPLDRFIQSHDSLWPKVDQDFLLNNLYPLTKGDVYVHEASRHISYPHYFGEPPTKKDLQGPVALADNPIKQRRFYVGEPIQPFNYFWGNFWYTRTGRPRRIFVALSIYKNIPFYEYFLAQFIGIIENRNLFRMVNSRTSKIFRLKIKFYVADDIRPDLVERLRRLGQVILKPAKTTHKDDPQYWGLSILADKNLGLAMIIGFWEFFFLICVARQGLNLISTPYKLTGSKILFRRLIPLSVCGPDAPVAKIDDLVAQRNPNASYQEFVHSTLSSQIATATTTVELSAYPIGVGVLKGWGMLLLPAKLYNAVKGTRVEKFLKKFF